PLVEVDSTFYRLQPARNFELWAERSPAEFAFDVKAYRTLTRHGAEHRPGARHEDDAPALDPADADFADFKESIEPLRRAGKLRSIGGLAERVKKVHVLINNNRGNSAIVNAQDAMRLLGQPPGPLDIQPYPPPDPGAAREPRADLPEPAPEQEQLPL